MSIAEGAPPARSTSPSLRTSQSYGFDVAGLAVGASQWYEVDLTCSEAVTVIVNPWNALPESNYNNNSVGFNGWCGL